ncbi:MAG: hypothetical protein COW85_09945 [Ignavibacteria bacterium CG22_combo_CG10-13_8_21_14_all_37_15]|nr:MAG: hypothetical protein COW85_09945 [Ignavibacteria bacterium CG22_combo_CG10-13_8_21_14_all_37_15]
MVGAITLLIINICGQFKNRGKKMKTKLFFLLLLLLFATTYPQWALKNNGMSGYVGLSIDAFQDSCAVASSFGGIFKTINQGENWEQLFLPDSTETVTDLSIVSPSTFYVGTDKGKIYKTSNGGLNWVLQFYDTLLTKYITYLQFFNAADGITGGDVLTGDPVNNPGPALILKTTDGGNNWISINDSAFGGVFSGNWQAVKFLNTETGFFLPMGGKELKLYGTNNGCKTWENIPLPTALPLAINFYDGLCGITATITTVGPKRFINVFLTKDGGENWVSSLLPSNGYPSDFEFIPGNKDRIWLSSLKELFFSSDFGKTWIQSQLSSSDPLGLAARDIVFTDDHNGWVLCDGKVYHTNNNDNFVTEIKEDFNPTLLSDFQLNQNYPNPFNSSTTISFTNNKKTFIKVELMNALGQFVENLFAAEADAGTHNIHYTANLSAGVYFLTLKASAYQISKKLILLK